MVLYRLLFPFRCLIPLPGARARACARVCVCVQLRMMDPENRTPVLRAFCYKQLVNVMLVGGGLFTSSSLAISHHAGPWVRLRISSESLLYTAIQCNPRVVHCVGV